VEVDGNVIGTNRGLLAAVASFDACKMASTRIMKISASIAVLPVEGTILGFVGGSRLGFNLRVASCVTRSREGWLREWSPIMAHSVERSLVERANAALVLAILWAALATCVLGALAYDMHYWFEGW
jgi:hypothetical protein